MRLPALRNSARVATIAGVFMLTTAAMPSAPALTGQWGGFQARLTLDATGGRLELDCASASIDSAVHPDADGSFSVDGRFEAYAPGPATRGDTPPVFTKARISGRVDGTALNLRLDPVGQEKAQDFALIRDRKVKIIRCY